MTPASPTWRPRLFDLLAAAACLAALWMGLETVRGLRWPAEPDLIRDIAQAQTIADGDLFGDAFYAGEATWYPPLVPALVAGLSRLAHVEVAWLHTHAGAALNLLAPVAFYVLSALLLGRPTALAALVAFLFLAPLPEWASPTYSPWLFASSFAQAPFYAALACYVTWWRDRRRSWPLLATGLFGGLAMLAHTAPAYLLLATVGVAGATASWSASGPDRRRLLLSIVAATAIAVAVATPYLVPLAVRYHLVVRNAAPLLWNDPAFTRAEAATFVVNALKPTLLHAGTLVGLVLLAWRRRPGLLPFWACLAAAIVFFVFTAWIRPHTGLSWMDRLPLGPSQHFLRYARACCAIGFGAGLVGTIEAAAALLGRFTRVPLADSTRLDRSVAVAVACVAIVVVSWTPYSQRADFTSARRAAARVFAAGDLKHITQWLRFSTTPRDVFLTTDSAGTSIIGTSGRKVVAVGKFFSSPYVDWPSRVRARDALWGALEESRCDEFARGAAQYGVTYVMTVRGRTPQIEDGRCRLSLTSFNGSDLKVYQVGGR